MLAALICALRVLAVPAPSDAPACHAQACTAVDATTRLCECVLTDGSAEFRLEGGGEVRARWPGVGFMGGAEFEVARADVNGEALLAVAELTGSNNGLGVDRVTLTIVTVKGEIVATLDDLEDFGWDALDADAAGMHLLATEWGWLEAPLYFTGIPLLIRRDSVSIDGARKAVRRRLLRSFETERANASSSRPFIRGLPRRFLRPSKSKPLPAGTIALGADAPAILAMNARPDGLHAQMSDGSDVKLHRIGDARMGLPLPAGAERSMVSKLIGRRAQLAPEQVPPAWSDVLWIDLR